MKIFKMNDCDWWMAETIEIAIRDYLEQTGLPRTEALCDGDPVELNDYDLDRIGYADHPGNPDDLRNRSFREQMNLRVAAGVASEFFASTEY